MSGRRPAPVMAALAMALCLSGARPAHAQGAPTPPSAAELAAARQLFGDALRAADEGRTREALEAFLRVEKIITSPQVHYQIGLCHEKLGELVEALNELEMAILEAEARRAADVLRESRAHADAVRKKVARLVIQVPADAAGLAITVDGRPVNAALAGTPMPVNPGKRRVAVRAESHAQAFEVTLDVAPGERRNLEAVLGAKKVAPPPAPLPVAPVAPPPAASSLGPKPSYVPAIVAGSATLAVTVGAVVTGVAAHADYSQYIRENVTPPRAPLAEREALRSAGIGKAWASTALTLAALAGGGATVYFLVRPPLMGGPARGVAWAPWAGPDGGGVVVGGAL